jgi:hypothetical protein
MATNYADQSSLYRVHCGYNHQLLTLEHVHELTSTVLPSVVLCRPGLYHRFQNTKELKQKILSLSHVDQQFHAYFNVHFSLLHLQLHYRKE